MIDISSADRVADVDARQWDALANGRVLHSHACLRLVEETSLGAVRCRHLLAWRDSQLQAALSWWVERWDAQAPSLEPTLFGHRYRAARALGLRTLPAMNGAGLLCSEPSVLFNPLATPAERAQLFGALLTVMEREAEEAGCAICFRNLPGADAGVSDVLSSRGYIRSEEMPVCYLDVEWDSFDGYVRELGKRHPRIARNIRNEINNGRRAGVVIAPEEDPAIVADQLHRLMEVHYRRLNGLPFPYGPDLFKKLKPYLAGRADVYTARIRGDIVAALIVFVENDTAFVAMVGVDDAFVRKHGVYFNLAFNRPIEDATNAGRSRLYFGRQVYEAKIRRGCRLVRGSLFVRGRGGLNHAALRFLLPMRNWRVNSFTAGLAHWS